MRRNRISAQVVPLQLDPFLANLLVRLSRLPTNFPCAGFEVAATGEGSRTLGKARWPAVHWIKCPSRLGAGIGHGATAYMLDARRTRGFCRADRRCGGHKRSRYRNGFGGHDPSFAGGLRNALVSAGSRLARTWLARGQLLAKERHQRGVELGMESRAIESRLVGADRGHDARIRTRRKEGHMARTGDLAILGRLGQ